MTFFVLSRWHDLKHNYFYNLLFGTRLNHVPHNLKIYKGSRYVLISREFTTFLLENPIAQNFRHWIKDTSASDESYIQSLARIQDIYGLGSFIYFNENTNDTFCLRSVIRNYSEIDCYGKFVRGVCHLTLEDLITVGNFFFHEKFFHER